MTRKKQERRTVSIRLPVYEAIAELAKQRGVALANLIDSLACRELSSVDVEVPGYVPPNRLEPKRARAPKRTARAARPAPTPIPISALTDALDQFNRDRGYMPARPVVTLRPDAHVEGNVQSQHIEF